MLGDNQQGEIKQLLQENQRLLIENNQMLHRMRRSSLIAALFRFLWFLILLGSIGYVYFTYVRPNIESIQEKIATLEAMASSDSSVFKKWYESVKTGVAPK
jgi:predicted PurR-regulated permease PerM